MNISSVNSDLIRGNVTTIILGSLWSADRYGYDILKEIENKSDGQYNIKQATLYNQLKKLEEQGLISSYDGDPDDTGGGKRKYFSLTAEGRAFLKKEKTEYEYSRTILDKLVSDQEFDFSAPLPFNASELRPYSKKNEEDKPKVVYKDKIVEKKLYFDRFGNEITEEEAQNLAAQAQEEDDKFESMSKQKDEEIQRISQELEDERARLLQEKEELQERLLKEKEEEIQRITQEKTEENTKKEQEYKQREAEFYKQNQGLYEKIRVQEEETKDIDSRRQQAEDQLKAIDEENLRIAREKAEQEERERLAAEEEERKKKEELEKPSLTLEEMFDKLDTESEYTRPQKSEFNYRPQEHTYINAYSGQIESDKRGNASMSDIFRVLDEKEAEIDNRNKIVEPETIISEENVEYIPQEEYVPQRFSDETYATSAVISKPNEGFAYENDNSTQSYRNFFYEITAPDEKPQKQEQSQQANIISGDIKTRLYAKGYKIRPYDRGNTSEYYTQNFVHTNRLKRDMLLIILGIFALEVGIMWASLASKVSYVYFLPILLCGAAIISIPCVGFATNPSKRIRANFNFKLSILITSMAWIELSVISILIGFFGLGASVDDQLLIICSIVLPMILLTNIPLASLVYWLLYRTRKYHTI